MRFPFRLVLALLAALAVITMTDAAVAKPTTSSTPTPSASSSQSGGPNQQAATSPKLTFGIGPALPVPATQVVDGRPYITYTSDPGGTINDAVAVLNLGTAPVRLHIYPTDGYETSDGSFTLLPASQKPKDAGAWIHASVPHGGTTVTVPPRHGDVYGRVEVPIRVNVPADATAGDHAAGVVASLESLGKNTKGARIRFDQRIGVRVYIHVTGNLKAAAAVEHLQASHEYRWNLWGRGPTRVSYTIKNTGNVRLNVTHMVAADGWFQGPVYVRPAALDDLLPGAAVKVRATIPRQHSLGKKTIVVTAFPVPVDPSMHRPPGLPQAHASFWTIPWLLIIVVVVVILLLVAAIRYWRRRRRGPDDIADDRSGGDSGDTGGRRRRDKSRTKRRKADPAKPRVPVARTAIRHAAVTLATSLALLSLPGAARADVASPTGGEAMLETGMTTGDPTHALTRGSWGHEGPHHDQGTNISADLSDASGAVTASSQAAWLSRFAVDDFDKIGVAFVKASADGSAERPEIHSGETAAQAFTWFAQVPFGTQLVGSSNPRSDSVLTVSTAAEFTAWVKAGKPVQYFDNSTLVAHDALVDGTPVSATPEGASILDRWPAGLDISLVLFRYDGFTPDGVPVLKPDAAGRAMTAWLTFRTAAGPTDPTVRTSASYQVLKTSPLPLPPLVIPSADASVARGRAGSTANPAGAASSSGTSSAATAAASATASPTTATDALGDSSASIHHARHTGPGALPWVIGLLAVAGIAGGSIALARRKRA